MQLIDTHVHINFEAFQADLEAVRSRWQAAGIVHLVHACVEPREFPSLQRLADRFPELAIAVGLHPLNVAESWSSTTADQILKLAQSDRRVVAIGEMGLDLYKATNQEQQEIAVWSQLAIARQLDKPVIIHCREAATPMVQILQQFWQAQGPVRGVMHCWGGTPTETQWFLDLGLYISFSGTATFKKATQIQDSARIVPGDRLLVETDCPFLAPTPKRGKRNEPAYVRHVAEQIATLRQVSLETLASQTTQNACDLFGLPQPQRVNGKAASALN